MNKYLINYKIATVAELIKSFNLGGYDFSSYTEEWWNCDAWVASKVIEANNAGEARYKFITDLIPQVEKCSVVSQCAFRIVANSYFIYKQNNNPDKVIFIYYVRDVGHTGLHFDTQEIEQLPKLDLIPNQKGLFYIMEAANASTFYTRLSMLLASAEGFAGEIRAKNQTRTDQTALENILGSELYKKLYSYGTGLRHKLFHGNIQAFDGLTEQIYDKLRTYLKTQFDIQLEENVVHPQRNFSDNFQYASTFEKLKDEKYLDLKLIEEVFDDDNPKKHETERLIFDGYVESPEDY
ncbi:MAG: hypothetical protein UT63_C0078G0005 [Candidatus Gottesmanbacteria bacterium GW2011_GWC2_39_8]|uniref:Uncharacterized protein n=1 Tax=Candidatus Gottesmanbacteria bacterium GW2011_GWC2_39_8 TaxID=1618450 RepID=A0A0G0S906_9BACT|nr:MAG: hypothetical protein UT63_C0078G0005 [Candidatus Gottesmanbacteria bacterium GW2011_GWC2_39_8]